VVTGGIANPVILTAKNVSHVKTLTVNGVPNGSHAIAHGGIHGGLALLCDLRLETREAALAFLAARQGKPDLAGAGSFCEHGGKYGQWRLGSEWTLHGIKTHAHVGIATRQHCNGEQREQNLEFHKSLLLQSLLLPLMYSERELQDDKRCKEA
jgi:hypothetical protein